MARAKKIIKKIKKAVKKTRKSRAKAPVKKAVKRIIVKVPCECVEIFKAGLINEHETCPKCKGVGSIKKRVKA